MSVSPSAGNNSALTGRISMKFVISIFFKNLSTKLSLKSDKNKTNKQFLSYLAQFFLE